MGGGELTDRLWSQHFDEGEWGMQFSFYLRKDEIIFLVIIY
jgi:hypothetical protein